MRLIGMLDSPYVRRVAISLEVLGIPCTHESVSVFSTFTQFKGMAVAWHFIQSILSELLPAGDYPRLASLFARMEATPDGPGVPSLAR